jgi:hypothetical protein
MDYLLEKWQNFSNQKRIYKKKKKKKKVKNKKVIYKIIINLTIKKLFKLFKIIKKK